MGRTKGSVKTGGRKRGTPNRVSKDVKTWISEVLEVGRDAFVVNLSQTEPKDFCKVYLGLLNYVMPKMVAVTADEVKRAEYNALGELFDKLPDEAIVQIAEKVLELEEKNNGR